LGKGLDTRGRIAIAICSRGLIHSRTMEAIDEAIYRAALPRARKFYTHDLSIPDAQNEVTERALAWSPEYLLFVEEDNGVPIDVFDRFTDADVQFVDYPLHNGQHAYERENGRVVFCGMGCLLVRSTVFDRLSRPWFRADLAFAKASNGRLIPNGENLGNVYGKQDIYFSWNLQNAGIDISVVEGCVADHYKVLGYGESGSNAGAHRIHSITFAKEARR